MTAVLAAGGEATGGVLDVTDRAAAEQVIGALPGIDILVTSAGVYGDPVPIEELAYKGGAAAYPSGMSASVYVESSVISYLTARPSRDVVTASRQAITAEWWQSRLPSYEAYVSVLVIEEISAGHPEAAAQRLSAVSSLPVVGIPSEALNLADALLKFKAVPANSDRDALHIAVAAYQGAEYLLTWNFKHINNAETRASIIRVVSEHGIVCPVLCSPEELPGDDHAE